MENYNSKWRKKKSKRTYTICTSNHPSLPIVECHEYDSQDSNNVETKVKSSSMHGVNVAPHSVKVLTSSKATATVILHRLHPRKKSNWKRKKFIEGVHTHFFDKKILERCHTNWEVSYFQYWEKDYEIILVRGLIALSPSHKISNKIWICKNADKEWSDIRAIRTLSAELILHSRLTNYVILPQREMSHKEWETHKRCTQTQNIEGRRTYFVVFKGPSTRSKI